MPVRRHPRAVRAAAVALAALPLLLGPVLTTPAAAAPESARPIDDACPQGEVPEDFFRDADEGPAEVHERAVDCIVWWGLARGLSRTTYGAGHQVDRAQLATFLAHLVLATGGTLPEPGEDRFTDDDDSPHEPQIERLAAAGIVRGRGDGRYDPQAPVFRGELATFLVQTYEYRAGVSLPSGGDHFTDDDDSVHEPGIDRAVNAGFTAGTGGRVYQPGLSLSREPMASFLARVLDLLVEDGLATPPQPAPGDLDASFGQQGVTRIAVRALPARNDAEDVALDPAGRVVLTGEDFSVVRLRADGGLDEGFGEGGAVTGAFGPDAQALAVGTGDDGSVVVGGLAPVGAVNQVALVRYTAEGRLDPAFGDGGRVTTELQFGGVLRDLVVLPDGGVVAAAVASSSDDAASTTDFAVLRYRSDGSLDPGFGDGGRVVADIREGNDYASALVVEPDGAVLVAGDSFAVPRPDTPTDMVWAIVRHLPDGSRDPEFGEDGTVLVDLGEGYQDLHDLAVQPDGAVVATGSVDPDGTAAPTGIAVARLRPSGELDTGFGTGGVVISRPAAFAEAADVEIQPDGRLLVAGRAAQESEGELPWEWAVLRLEPDGRLDPGFGEDGVALTAVGRDANAAALQPDGRLVVVGCDCPVQAGPDGYQERGSSFTAARFHAADLAARP